MKKKVAYAACALIAAALLVGIGRSRSGPDARAFVNGLPDLTPEMKLVVARLDFTQTTAAESPKRAWGVDWGTTKAEVSVPVRAHYALDLSGPEPVRFRFDPARGALTAVFPDPEVQALEVLSQDRRALVQAGWGRLEALSGRSLLERLDRDTYGAARAQAASPRVLARSKDAARPALARLLESYARRSGAGVREVRVRFASDEETAAAPSPERPRIFYNLR